jgi:predicted RNA-binding protein YlxR (DUF448 family)
MVMGKGAGPKPAKRQPERTCVGCGLKRPKKDLVRVVRAPSGQVEVDPSGRRAGRGAYLCPGRDCLLTAAKGKKLERALEAPVPDAVHAFLAEAMVEVSRRTGSVPVGSKTPTPGSVVSPSDNCSGRNPMKG